MNSFLQIEELFKLIETYNKTLFKLQYNCILYIY